MKQKYFTEEERKEARRKSAANYANRNREKVLTTQREYKSRPEIQKRRMEYRRNYRKSRAGLLGRLIEVAKARQPDTDLDKEYLDTIFKDRCSISGTLFNPHYETGGSYNPYQPSLDRIDSTKGYFKGNVQVILQSINKWKNDTPDQEFKEVMKTVFESWKALTHAD